MSKSSLEFALEYYRFGLCPIPTYPESAKPYIHWTKYRDSNSRPSESEVERWFASWPLAGIQILLGAPSSGYFVFDFESESGYEHFIKLKKINCYLPTVKSNRGYHVYHMINNFIAPYKTIAEIADQPLEILGQGHLISAPPSLHRGTGKLYRWIYPLMENIEQNEYTECLI